MAEEGRASGLAVMQGLGRKAVICQPGSVKEFVDLQRGTGPVTGPRGQGEKERKVDETSWKSADCQLPLTLASTSQRALCHPGHSVCAGAHEQTWPAAPRERDGSHVHSVSRGPGHRGKAAIPGNPGVRGTQDQAPGGHTEEEGAALGQGLKAQGGAEAMGEHSRMHAGPRNTGSSPTSLCLSPHHKWGCPYYLPTGCCKY